MGMYSFYYYLFLVLFGHAQTFISCLTFIFISPSLYTPPHHINYSWQWQKCINDNLKQEHDMKIKSGIQLKHHIQYNNYT